MGAGLAAACIFLTVAPVEGNATRQRFNHGYANTAINGVSHIDFGFSPSNLTVDVAVCNSGNPRMRSDLGIRQCPICLPIITQMQDPQRRMNEPTVTTGSY